MQVKKETKKIAGHLGKNQVSRKTRNLGQTMYVKKRTFGKFPIGVFITNDINKKTLSLDFGFF